MNKNEYKTAVFNAFECGCAKLPIMKTQMILKERFGNDLEPPTKYDGMLIIDAYMKGYANGK